MQQAPFLPGDGARVGRVRSWHGEAVDLLDSVTIDRCTRHAAGALDQAAPLRGWKLDPAFDTLRRLLEARFGPRGKRENIQVLRLHEDFPERQVAAVVRDAVKRRLIGFDAVKHLLLARIERRPAHLDLSRYPHLPQPVVAATRSADYATLLAGGAGHG